NIQKNLNLVNEKFQDLYRAKYAAWIKQADAPVTFTHQFVSRVMKTYWDYAGGQKAVVLIFDGLRTDAWEELVKPVLEEKYDTIHEIPASAILPTETHLSRKAISAGCLPSEFERVSTSENKLLEHGLKQHMGIDLKLQVIKEDDNVESGI